MPLTSTPLFLLSETSCYFGCLVDVPPGFNKPLMAISEMEHLSSGLDTAESGQILCPRICENIEPDASRQETNVTVLTACDFGGRVTGHLGA